MVGPAIKTPNPSTPPPQKPQPTSPRREAGSTPRRSGRWPTFVRVLVSLLIVWHFSGIFLAAMAIPGPTSPLVMNIAENPKSPMRLYLDALYLNQGHAFFAPDVGPGHLIQYECFDASGKTIERGELPNRKENWPRLLYHRYFMLADQSDGWGDDKQTRDARQQQYLKAFALHLLYVNKDAESVRVRRYAHWPLPIDLLPDRKRGYQQLARELSRQFGEDVQIDDQGYQFLGEATQTRSAVEPPSNKQTMDWQSYRANTASRSWGISR
ncbi:MAG TPA: hypothetical protein VFW73_10345 [Lacipirellulaceae bacterium]|nr:hypothetical protein [Lacipirellulaceae bacterium]